MKRGTPVFIARVTERGQVEVAEARVETAGRFVTFLDRPVDGQSRAVPTKLLHVTRRAALYALAERMEGFADQASSPAMAKRSLAHAETAKKMAEASR